jgi:serine/threonine-protein kinase
MEFGAGTLRDDFEDWAKASARPPFSTRLADASALCSGLAAIHAVGIIHRDVTPSNILRMNDGRLVVTDFGLAIGTNDKTTFHGGVPKYMAPEVLGGAPADQRADVWQLGLLLHDLLFGRPLWTADRTALISPVPANATAAEHELWAVCSSCLSPNPSLRPASAVVVAGALSAAITAKPYTRANRLLRRLRRLAARRSLHWSAGAALVIAAAAILTPSVILKPRMCRGATARVADLWDSSRQTAVKNRFAETHHATAIGTFATVDRIMRQYVDRWTAAYTDACEATHVRGEQSLDVLDLRMSCLGEELEGARALATTFAEADSAVVDNAVQAASSYGDLHRCQDTRGLRSGSPLPSDKRQREVIDDIRRRLAALRARVETGQAAAVAPMMPAIEAEARATNYCPLIAEALSAKGHVEWSIGTVGFRQTLESSIWTAESCGADHSVAAAATDLVFPQSEADIPFGEKWAQLAAAAMQRQGGNPKLESWLDNNRAVLKDMLGDRAAAVQYAQMAVATKERLLGRDHLDVGISLGNLAELLVAQNRPLEALTAGTRSVAILEGWLGQDHVEVAAGRSQRGDALEALGRVDEATADFRTSIGIFDAHRKDDPSSAYAHAGLGRISLRKGSPHAALEELERARSLLDGTADRWALARVEFDLAKAQLQSGNPTSARELAKISLERYGADERHAAEHQLIADWLADESSMTKPLVISSARPKRRKSGF